MSEDFASSKASISRGGGAWTRLTVGCALGMIVLVPAPAARSAEFGGIEFPQGATSFADAVLRYDPMLGGGPVPDAEEAREPSHAFGPPDFPPGGPNTLFGFFLTLGSGGLVQLRFVDNVLTNSGTDAPDLHVFEVGTDVEDMFVALRPVGATAGLLGAACSDERGTGAGFCATGKISAPTSSIDIDAVFPGFAAGALRFDAVELVDDPLQGGTFPPTPGADVDAVGAISSASAVQSGVQYCRDRTCTLITKDVGNDRWSMTYRVANGQVTGNIFRSGGGDPAFVGCDRIASDGVKGTFECFGTDRCAAGPCPSSQYAPIGTIELPLTFFFPPGEPVQ